MERTPSRLACSGSLWRGQRNLLYARLSSLPQLASAAIAVCAWRKPPASAERNPGTFSGPVAQRYAHQSTAFLQPLQPTRVPEKAQQQPTVCSWRPEGAGGVSHTGLLGLAGSCCFCRQARLVVPSHRRRRTLNMTKHTKTFPYTSPFKRAGSVDQTASSRRSPQSRPVPTPC
jgi:hypothetical protein